MAKQKFYVVWEGRKRGIFTDWESAKESVFGFEKAKYKSFESRAEAEFAFAGKAEKFIYGQKASAEKGPAAPKSRSEINWDHSICTDAACSGNPGDMEYRGVVTRTGEQIFHQGPFPEGTNNIGEFLGLVHALAYLKKHGDATSTIYTDSKTAIAWVRNRKPKTTLERTNRNRQIFELLDRAVAWLEANEWENPILKWETEVWGEIPADFGRK